VQNKQGHEKTKRKEKVGGQGGKGEEGSPPPGRSKGRNSTGATTYLFAKRLVKAPSTSTELEWYAGLTVESRREKKVQRLPRRIRSAGLQWG